MHLPMVLVNTLPGQERANAMHMKNQGCAEWVKRDELPSTVKHFLTNPDLRLRMSKACGESLPDSESDVVRILYDMMNK